MSRRSRSSAKRTARFSSPSGWCPRSAEMCRFSTVHAPRCVSPALDGQGQVTPGKADRLLGSGANDGRRNEENRRDSSMAARCGATGKAQADFFQQLVGVTVALGSIFQMRPHDGELIRKFFQVFLEPGEVVKEPPDILFGLHAAQAHG